MNPPRERFAHDLAIVSTELDSPSARALAAALANQGVRLAWWPGDPPALAQQEQLAEHARWVCVLWSATSRGHAPTQALARRALTRLALLQVQLDLGEVPDGFADRPVVSLAGWQGERSEPVFRHLVESLALMLGVAPGHAVTPPPAPASAPAAGSLLERVGHLVQGWLRPSGSAKPALPESVRRVPTPAAQARFERTVPMDLDSPPPGSGKP